MRRAAGRLGVERLPLKRRVIRHREVADQANLLQTGKRQISHVDFPPAVAVSRTARVGVVIVVPAFSVGQNRKQPVVATVFTSFIVAIAPHVSRAVDRPRHMPSVNRSHDDTPEKELGGRLRDMSVK